MPKFYRYLFWFLFEVCATNAYILYNDHSGQPKKTLKEFRLELARGLVGDYHSKKRAGHCPSTPTTLPIRHFPIKLNDGSTSAVRRRCWYCQNRRQPSQRRDTVWYCNECKVHLCHTGDAATDCFLQHHK